MTNILLAIILALAIGFFSNMLNDAIESKRASPIIGLARFLIQTP